MLNRILVKGLLLSKALFLLASVFSSPALAGGGGGGGGVGNGVLFDINVYYYSQTVTNNSQTSSSSTTAIYDLKVGEVKTTGLYYGGIYTTRSSSGLSQAGTGGSAWGPSLGYIGRSGFFVQGHYLFSASYGTWSGSGEQVDFGYLTMPESSIVVGVELTYRTITYTKDSASPGTTLNENITEMIPMFTLGYLF